MQYPSIGTMASRALAPLLAGEELSHRDIFLSMSTYRLAASIHKLRKMGWEISDKWEEALTKDPADRIARYKRYFLNKSIIAIASNDGKKFVENVRQWETKRKERAAATAQSIGVILLENQHCHYSNEVMNDN